MIYSSVKALIEILESTEASTVAAKKRVGIDHLSKMKPLEFIALLKHFRDDLGGLITSEKIRVTEKVDGAGLRFGVDPSGRFFLESSHSGPQFEPGAFSAYTLNKFGASNAISDSYDDVFEQLRSRKNLQDVLKSVDGGVRVVCEMLYNPSATAVEGGLRFVTTTYDPSKLGRVATLVVFSAESLNGESNDSLLDEVVDCSDRDIKIARPELKFNDVDVTVEIDDFFTTISSFDKVEEVLTSRKAVDRPMKLALVEIFEKFQKEISEKIASGIANGSFGPELEGAVFDTGSKSFKIVTDRFKKNKEEYNSEYIAKRAR